MKPAASTIVNSGNLGGVTKTMTIQRDAMAHIMSILTNLYSDAILAVIREYATNALDAHRQSRFTGPIVVSLPSALRPTFTVEDFGVGMSTDTLLDLYSSYGASTKRETNEQTGMLGVGSKSALAYSSQFTIRSRHAGVETTALVFLNDRGEGEIKVVDTKATDETGTRIEIPVTPKDADTFRERAAFLFSFWNRSDVTVKGVDVNYGNETWIPVTDHIFLASKHMQAGNDGYRYGYRYGNGDVYVVQGGVPYKIDTDSLSAEAKEAYKSLPIEHHDVVLITPIGSVQFTPSRESLYYTNETNNVLRSLFASYRKHIGKYVTKAVADAADKTEALSLFEKYRHLIGDGAVVKWQGKTVPSSVPCVALATDTAKRASGTKHKTLPNLSTMNEFDLVIYGASYTQVTDKGSYPIRVNAAGHLGKGYKLNDVSYYSRNRSGDTMKILIIEGDLPEGFDWYGKTAVTVEAIKPAKVAGQGGKRVSQADKEYRDREWRIAGKWQTVKVDPEDDKVLYVPGTRQYDFGNRPADWTVVMVPANQHKRFAAAFPKAMTPEQAAEKAKKEAGITYDEAASTYRRAALGSRFSALDPAKVLDPDLRTVVQWIKEKPESVKEGQRLAESVRWLRVPFIEKDSPTPTLDRVVNRYRPVLNNSTDLLMLVNAIYSYNGGNK